MVGTQMLKAPAEIEVETSPAFDRIWYRVQTFLQILLAAVILAGLAGCFGGGWLSTSNVQVGPAEVSYDRFTRKTVPFRITVRFDDRQSGGPLHLTLSRELTGRAGIIRTVPTAASSRNTSDGVDYEFATSGAGSEIVVSVQPDRPGVFEWRLKIGGAGETSLFQIIYP